jgi:hypothetical protein
MARKRHQKLNQKKLLIGVVAGALLAAPIGVGVYANEEKVPEVTAIPTETSVELVQEKPVILVTESTEPPVDQTTTPTVPEVVEETETPAPETPAETDLQAAIAIAATEHPDVVVVSARLKHLAGEKVFKVTFEDGWRIYISATSGEIIKIKDGSNKDCGIHNRAKKQWLKEHKQWRPYTQESRDSQERRVRERDSEKEQSSRNKQEYGGQHRVSRSNYRR